MDHDNFIDAIGRAMQDELTKALEPMIRESIDKIEKDMRERLGLMVIRLIETSYSVQQDRQEILITVRREEP